MKKISADIVVDLIFGDAGKGKVVHSLLKENKYTHAVRFAGGNNCGHTIYHKDQKIVTHAIPAGVFYGIKSVIGLGCVVNVDHLHKEIAEIESYGFDVKNNLFIDKRAHIVTTAHLEEDAKDTKIGTTKKGIGPAYTDKVGRVGLKVENCSEMSSFNIIDAAEEFYTQDTNIIFEGSQGFGLDIDWGDYPYVTSSGCTVATAINNGVPPQAIKNIYGVAKAYDTYVGAKQFQPADEVFDKLCELGNEVGATTGRKRQCNWLNLDSLIVAAKVQGVTEVIINKVDILAQLGIWKLIHNKEIIDLGTQEEFCNYIKLFVKKNTFAKSVRFSFSPKEI